MLGADPVSRLRGHAYVHGPAVAAIWIRQQSSFRHHMFRGVRLPFTRRRHQMAELLGIASSIDASAAECIRLAQALETMAQNQSVVTEKLFAELTRLEKHRVTRRPSTAKVVRF